MSLISRVIKNLTNGISQQAPSVRLDNQVEDQVNMIPDISGILTRRSPVSLEDVIVQDGSRTYADEHAMFNMTINEEQVAIGVKPDGTVYRFDEGFEATTMVQAASVKTYLTHKYVYYLLESLLELWYLCQRHYHICKSCNLL